MMSLLLEVCVGSRFIVVSLLSWRWAINHDKESFSSRNVHEKTKNVLSSPEAYHDMRNKFACEFYSCQGGRIERGKEEQQVLRKFMFNALGSMNRSRVPQNNQIKPTPRKFNIFSPPDRELN